MLLEPMINVYSRLLTVQLTYLGLPSLSCSRPELAPCVRDKSVPTPARTGASVRRYDMRRPVALA